MRGQAVLAILSFLAVALSGCTGDEPGLKELEYEPVVDDSPGDAPAGNGTDDADDENETVAPNAAPTAGLAASVTNGTAPLNVTFALDGADADGDDLAWTFTVGNLTRNGTALPASVNATLDVGNWTATLTVSDGTNETVASVVVSVEDAAGGAPAGPFAALAGAWAVGATEVPNIPDTFFCSAGPSEGVTHATLTLPAGSGGRTFTATLSAGTGIESVPEWGLYVMPTSCDGTLEFFGEAVAPVGGGVTGTITGTLPADAGTLVAYSTGGAMLELAVTIN